MQLEGYPEAGGGPASFTTNDGRTALYDRENPDAWVVSDTTWDDL